MSYEMQRVDDKLKSMVNSTANKDKDKKKRFSISRWKRA